MHLNRNGTARIRNAASIPFIWATLIPIVFADIIIEIYHRACFPLYGIPIIKRSKYIRIDRHRLSYLTLREKIGCIFCGYANGWLRYASMIASSTELYWCDIKHEKKRRFIEPSYQKDFFEYGDERAYKKRHGNHGPGDD